MDRVKLPPKACPKCKRGEALWITYKKIEDAPAAGCGNCGHVVYLIDRPPHSAFYVTNDSTQAA